MYWIFNKMMFLSLKIFNSIMNLWFITGSIVYNVRLQILNLLYQTTIFKKKLSKLFIIFLSFFKVTNFVVYIHFNLPCLYYFSLDCIFDC